MNIANLARRSLSLLTFFASFYLVAVDYDDPNIVKRFIDPTGREVIVMRVPGSPPPAIRPKAIILPKKSRANGVNILDNVPAFNWTYGCSATSAGMMIGYYDRTGYSHMYTGSVDDGVCPLNNSVWGGGGSGEGSDGECPFIASHMGIEDRETKGHVDDFWFRYNSIVDPYYNSWEPHVIAGEGDCLGDFMGTNQYHPDNLRNIDGATTFWYYSSDPYVASGFGDGGYGIRLYAEDKGYKVTNCYNQYIEGYAGSGGYTFSQFKTEIDNGRPILIHLKGHTVIGFGYDTSNGAQTVYLHDTWDYQDHEMEWGGSYSGMQHLGVSVFHLKNVVIPTLTITAPNGGEYWKLGNTVEITWTSENHTGGVDLYLLKSDTQVAVIAEDIDDSGSYEWTVPDSLSTGDDYYVKIVCSTDSSVADQSDQPFSISDTVTDLSIDAVTIKLDNNADNKDSFTVSKANWPSNVIPDSVQVEIGGWARTFDAFEAKGTKYVQTVEDAGAKYQFSVDTKNNLWTYKGSKATIHDSIAFVDNQLTCTLTMDDYVASRTMDVVQKTTWKFASNKNTSAPMESVDTTMTEFSIDKANGRYQSDVTGKDVWKITKATIGIDGDINPAVDLATIQIDGLVLGPFTLVQKNESKKVYEYTSDSADSPQIKLKLDLDKGVWSLNVGKGDCSGISGADVDIILKVGDHVGALTLNTDQKTKLTYKP